MMSRSTLAWIAILSSTLVDGAMVRGDESADAATLRDARVTPDGPGLLAYLRNQTLSDDDNVRLRQTIRCLGDRIFAVREQASRELLAAERSALPFLRPALLDSDPEIRKRARRCIDAIEQGPALSRLEATVRLIALRRPEGAAEVLLNFLPFVDHDTLEDEILASLKVVGINDGKAEPALVGALQDKLTVKRSAAARVLGQAPHTEQRAAVKPLLQDPEAKVRFRAAQGLLAGKEKVAIPVLAALLSEAPVPLAWQAEEQLCLIAGEQSPPLALGAGDLSVRRKCRAAWEEWWGIYGAALDLYKVDIEQRTLGLTLIVVYDGYANGQGRVWEFGADRLPRWKIETDLQGPIDAQVLPGNRVLLAEYNAQRVTERDVNTGQIVWECKINGNPVACQRLPNGNTFVATLNAILEVRPNKQEVFSYTAKHNQVTYAQKLRNGHIYHVSSNGVLVELDAEGKEIRNFKVGNNTEWLTFEILPGGRILVPQQSGNQVIEFDALGNVVRTDKVSSPYSAVRLPNGNVLACSMNGSSVAEIDRAGNQVWKDTLQGRPFRVRRR